MEVSIQRNKDTHTTVLTADKLTAGMGNTIGNFVRRCVMINDTGWALAAVKINQGNIKTVFDNIEGVAEDCLELYTNLANMKVTGKGNIGEHKICQFESAPNLTVLKAKDLQNALGDLTVLNPEQELCHFISGGRVILELVFRYQTGCVSDTENKLFIHSMQPEDLASAYITFSSTHRTAAKSCHYTIDTNEDLTEKLTLVIEGYDESYSNVLASVLTKSFKDLNILLRTLIQP